MLKIVSGGLLILMLHVVSVAQQNSPSPEQNPEASSTFNTEEEENKARDGLRQDTQNLEGDDSGNLPLESEQILTKVPDDTIPGPEKSPSDSLVRVWYEPLQMRRDGEIVVVVSGLAQPQVQIGLGGEILRTSQAKEVTAVNTKNALVSSLPVEARKDGYFALELRLADGDFQLPLEVSSPSGDTVVNYLLSLSLDKSDIELQTAIGEIEKSPFVDGTFNAWFGTGLNFLLYKQELSGGEAEFQSLTGPSFFIKGQMRVNNDWALQGTGKNSPGATSSSDLYTVTQGSYNWLTLAGELLYSPERWITEVSGQTVEWSARGGFQQHFVPFLKREQASTYSVDERTLTFATIGAQAEINKNHRFYYEILARYQYPVASSFNFEVNGNINFDGSVGAIYRYDHQWRFGLFWYGQLHQYHFEDATLGTSGDQTLFYSNLELRAGLDF